MGGSAGQTKVEPVAVLGVCSQARVGQVIRQKVPTGQPVVSSQARGGQAGNLKHITGQLERLEVKGDMRRHGGQS